MASEDFAGSLCLQQRYHRLSVATLDGSRNLTHPMNGEAGLNLTSRADGKGQKVPGVSRLAADLATRSGLSNLSAHEVSREMERLTWECPPGCKLQQLSLARARRYAGIPAPEIRYRTGDRYESIPRRPYCPRNRGMVSQQPNARWFQAAWNSSA